MRIAFITLGCPKNLVDTEVMLGLLDEAGHQFEEDASEADVAIVSTCSFISAAVQESLEIVRGCLCHKEKGRPRYVVVAGCLPQRYGERTFDMLPGVDAVVGCSDFESIVDVVERAASGQKTLRVSEPVALYDHLTPRILGTPSHIAYVKIAEGCDNRCSYCTIPSIRGRLRSRAPESIVAEVEELAEAGVREVNLIAQDTTAYGTDIASSLGLPEIIARVAAVGVPWVRLLYTHPAHVTDEVLTALARYDEVVPYLDMPIQHVSDQILAAMGRRTDGAHIRSTIERARETIPDVTIRSSVMVGFPGETEREFEELRSFLSEGPIDHLGIFEYSPEPGTPAALLDGGVDAGTARSRAEILAALMEDLAETRGERLVGLARTVLVDSVDDVVSTVTARTSGQAWEIDGTVAVGNPEGFPLSAGDFADVVITEARAFDLRARFVGGRDAHEGGGESA